MGQMVSNLPHGSRGRLTDGHNRILQALMDGLQIHERAVGLISVGQDGTVFSSNLVAVLIAKGLVDDRHTLTKKGIARVRTKSRRKAFFTGRR